MEAQMLANEIVATVNELRDIGTDDPVGVVVNAVGASREQVIQQLIELDNRGVIEVAYGTSPFDERGQTPGKFRCFSIHAIEGEPRFVAEGK